MSSVGAALVCARSQSNGRHARAWPERSCCSLSGLALMLFKLAVPSAGKSAPRYPCISSPSSTIITHHHRAYACLLYTHAKTTIIHRYCSHVCTVCSGTSILPTSPIPLHRKRVLTCEDDCVTRMQVQELAPQNSSYELVEARIVLNSILQFRPAKSESRPAPRSAIDLDFCFA